MRSYAKLAIFIAVLLFSVSMLSVAIDYLGPIERVDINIDIYNTVSSPGNPGMPQDGKPAKGKGASLGQQQPLFEIYGVPETQYLRWVVDEVYNLGNWEFDYERTAENYYGGEVYDNLNIQSDHDAIFIIKPLFNLTEFYPATYPLNWMSFDQIFTGYYYRDLKTFFTVEPLITSYTINHPVYEFTDSELRLAAVEINDEYLEVPLGIESQLIDLANRIVVGYNNPYDKLKAIEGYLKDNYNYTADYSLAPNGTDSVEYFLFHSREGVCSQFNSAFVLLSRVLDIPARTVKGFSIKPYDPYQIVLSKNAHMWAEVPFMDYGWIEFDATPVVQEERPATEPIIPTVCNITYNDPIALKGGSFNVLGTVKTVEDEMVDGIQVEVLLNVKKDKNGIRCGVGNTVDGLFNITCVAPTDIEVMDYNLIAHALPSARYDESWSDPPIRIMAETNVTLYGQNTGFVNDTLFFSGMLYERVSGEPIINSTVTVKIEDETLTFTTDEEGMISLSHRFHSEGNKTINLIMDESSYYLDSNTSFGVSVTLPPDTEKGLLQLLTTFPNNLLVFGGCIIIIGAVYIFTQKKSLPVPITHEDEYIDDEDLDTPITYSDYKEGVVKIFNRFYKINRRRYDEIKESMTPREFQYAMHRKMPKEGKQPLEYLITAFEIADYSLGRPTKEMFDKCEKAVELLTGLITIEQKEE